MDKYLDIYNLLELSHDDIAKLNKPTTKMEIQLVMKTFPSKRPGSSGFTVNLYVTFKE